VDSDEARHANESIENATGKKSATQRAQRVTENTEERREGRTSASFLRLSRKARCPPASATPTLSLLGLAAEERRNVEIVRRHVVNHFTDVARDLLNDVRLLGSHGRVLLAT
jgi:hypothetical protein